VDAEPVMVDGILRLCDARSEFIANRAIEIQGKGLVMEKDSAVAASTGRGSMVLKLFSNNG
jgi:hypothetical protein